MNAVKMPFALVFSLVLGACLAQGATHNVGAGQSIQTAINGAANGDTIVLTAPTEYAGHLTINGKALRIKAMSDQTNIVGNLSISGVPANGKVVLRNCKLTGNVDANGSSLDLLRCIVDGTVTLPAKQGTTGNDLQLTVLQSDLRLKLSSKAARSWIGYSTLYKTYLENKLEIVGNVFDGRDLGGIGLDLNGSATEAAIHNNQIINFAQDSGVVIEGCIGIRIDGGAKATIRNNRINNNAKGSNSSSRWVGMGVYVKSTSGTRIEGNHFYKNFFEYGHNLTDYLDTIGDCHIYAQAQNMVVRNNSFHLQHASSGSQRSNANARTKGGVLSGEYVSTHSGRWDVFLTNPTYLAQGYPTADKGPYEAIHLDHDGSRNDIGPNGGRNYIPDGRTTDKPIPISFTIAPQIVPVGGTVTIESTGATVK